MNEVIDLITKKIAKCNEFCFCTAFHRKEGLPKDQQKCGNCHSKDILVELLKEVNDLSM